MNDKPRITGQLVNDNGKYIAVWLVDSSKHTKHIYAKDSKEANEKF